MAATPLLDTTKTARLRRVIRPIGRITLLLMLPLTAVLWIYLDPAGALSYLRQHAGVVVWVAVLGVFFIGWAAVAHHRRLVLRDPKRARGRPARMPLRPLRHALLEWVDLLTVSDSAGWRIGYAVCTAATVYAVTRPAALAWPIADRHTVMIAVIAPLAWAVLIGVRLHIVGRRRTAVVDVIHSQAAECLGYPKPHSRQAHPSDLALTNPWRAVRVHEWEGRTLPRKWWVAAPRALSATDSNAWHEFEANINQMMPHPEGWHLKKDPLGRGALVTPANYPPAVLWDGEQDPDPLTFLVGADLDAPGQWAQLTFGETTPHLKGTGATGSGKTSFAEDILAQAATKPMPWRTDLVAQSHIIDPKGPFAQRWEGRANVHVTNGSRDLLLDSGDTVSGVVAMCLHIEEIHAQMMRRQEWLDQFADAGKWLDVGDEVLAREGMAPIFVFLDEYLDHTTRDPGKSEEVERNNAARDRLVYLTGEISRKGRALGVHLYVIAHDAKMTELGGTLVRMLIGSVVMGNMDSNANRRMFGTGDVPVLPTHRQVGEEFVAIPGRCRVQNAPGMPIRRIQAAWFGDGDSGPNTGTLDKHLPRGPIPPSPIPSAASHSRPAATGSNPPSSPPGPVGTTPPLTEVPDPPAGSTDAPGTSGSATAVLHNELERLDAQLEVEHDQDQVSRLLGHRADLLNRLDDTQSDESNTPHLDRHVVFGEHHDTADGTR